jgi:hypothetical protein
MQGEDNAGRGLPHKAAQLLQSCQLLATHSMILHGGPKSPQHQRRHTSKKCRAQRTQSNNSATVW